MDPAIAPPPPPGMPLPPGHVHAPAVRAEQRRWRVAGLAAALGATAYVGLVDPSEGGAFPLCPSRVVPRARSAAQLMIWPAWQ